MFHLELDFKFNKKLAIDSYCILVDLFLKIQITKDIYYIYIFYIWIFSEKVTEFKVTMISDRVLNDADNNLNKNSKGGFVNVAFNNLQNLPSDKSSKGNLSFITILRLYYYFFFEYQYAYNRFFFLDNLISNYNYDSL